MDVDGTLTDGKIYMGNDGEIMKAFDIKDGYGIHDILIPFGIIPVIITGRKSKIVKNRSAELGIEHYYQGVSDKTRRLIAFLDEKESGLNNVAYIGDDKNDLDCMKAVKEAGGVIGCPADAVDAVRQFSDYVSSKNGGDGAVREFIEWLVEQNQIEK